MFYRQHLTRARTDRHERETMTMTMFLLNSGHLPSLKGVTKFYARSNFYITHLAEAHIHEHILSLTHIHIHTNTHSLSLSLPPLSLTHTHTHARTHAHTHTQTQAHIHTCVCHIVCSCSCDIHGRFDQNEVFTVPLRQLCVFSVQTPSTKTMLSF